MPVANSIQIRTFHPARIPKTIRDIDRYHSRKTQFDDANLLFGLSQPPYQFQIIIHFDAEYKDSADDLKQWLKESKTNFLHKGRSFSNDFFDLPGLHNVEVSHDFRMESGKIILTYTDWTTLSEKELGLTGSVLQSMKETPEWMKQLPKIKTHGWRKSTAAKLREACQKEQEKLKTLTNAYTLSEAYGDIIIARLVLSNKLDYNGAINSYVWNEKLSENSAENRLNDALERNEYMEAMLRPAALRQL